MSQVRVFAVADVLCSSNSFNRLSDQLVVAALRVVRSSLPDEEFVTQLGKLKALQLRIQAVFNRLKIVEASPGASPLQDRAEPKSLVVLCRTE